MRGIHIIQINTASSKRVEKQGNRRSLSTPPVSQGRVRGHKGDRKQFQIAEIYEKLEGMKKIEESQE